MRIASYSHNSTNRIEKSDHGNELGGKFPSQIDKEPFQLSFAIFTVLCVTALTSLFVSIEIHESSHDSNRSAMIDDFELIQEFEESKDAAELKCKEICESKRRRIWKAEKGFYGAGKCMVFGAPGRTRPFCQSQVMGVWCAVDTDIDQPTLALCPNNGSLEVQINNSKHGF